MKAIILAAGRGIRLASLKEPKPLVPLLGLPLLERVIMAAARAGVDEFCVVTGFRAQEIETFLRDLSRRRRLKITAIYNDHWKEENALSALKGASFVGGENFLLLMADHLFDEAIIRDLLKTPPRGGQVILAVDRRLDNPQIDPEEATKVLISTEGIILDIGKDISPYNGFDTGLFYCSAALFEAIEESLARNQDGRLASAMRLLAQRGRLLAKDIGDRFWIDVDDITAWRRAKEALLDSVRQKPTDGPVARYLNRPISLLITERFLLNRNISPNQISLFCFFLSLLAAGIFCLPFKASLALGGIVAQMASIIDGCDGEVARLKYLESPFGGWLDRVLDRYADALIILGFSLSQYLHRPDNLLLGLTFGAFVGSFMVSYTAPGYDELLKQSRIPSILRIGRDIRIFLIFCGALLGQITATLALLATIMNGEVLRRIFVFYKVKDF
ncbi:NTP transferase domain-containing protein [Thermosulfuriphilus sp.]